MIADIIQNINFFVDGRGYAGKVAEFTPPKLTVKTQEYYAGGMAAPIDVPMGGFEKLECSIDLKAFDEPSLTLFNIIPGATVPFTGRAAVADDDGTIHAVVVRMRGVIKEYDMGTWKPADEAMLKLGLTLRFYELERDGLSLIKLGAGDPPIFEVNGKDLLAPTRAALGI